MIIHCISLVPSKMVKILAIRAVPQVSDLKPSVISARIQHAPSEMNAGFVPARVRFRSWYECTPRKPVSLATALLHTTPRQVHRRYISALTCQYPAAGHVARSCEQRPRRTRAGQPGMRRKPRAARCRADTPALRPDGRIPPISAFCSRIAANGSGSGTRRFMPCWRRASAACQCVPPRCPVRSLPVRRQPPPAASPSASSQLGCQSRGLPGISRA